MEGGLIWKSMHYYTISITIFNPEMKSVYSIQPKERQWTVNMSKLPAGVYIISVTTMTDQFAQRIVRL
jgi:hypothetical protein